MNNRDVWYYLSIKESVRDTAKACMQEFQIEKNEYEPIKQEFNILNSIKDCSKK